MRNRILPTLATIAASVGLLALGMAQAPLAFSAAIAIDPNHLPAASPGFLVVISEPGSYRLTGNLTVPDANTTAIEINADNVSIDLGGFAILGPAKCSSPPVSCLPTGTGNGVHVVYRDNIAVSNGSIRGMGNYGLYLETRSGRIDKVDLVSNGGGGALLFGGVISDSSAEANGGAGVFGLDITVRGNLIRNNQHFGLEAYGLSAYANNRLSGNNNNAAQVNRTPTQGGRNQCKAADCP
ncbi:right-handed parallel beta-helix repeat-containing protein [Paraherbaspirillum soli]|uniref:Right-handed parallel beta-helix repeat-containing protein n=1 Tax=Paraherbaspirillum soli TaxID=631222 RepID=A0ABW0M972_9BURK